MLSTAHDHIIVIQVRKRFKDFHGAGQMFGQPEACRIPEKFIVFPVFQRWIFNELIGIVFVQALGVSGPAGIFHAQIFQNFSCGGEITDASRICVRVFFIKSQHGTAGFFMVNHTLSHSDSGLVKRVGAD